MGIAAPISMGDEYEGFDDDSGDEERRAVVPNDMKNLRACLRCYLVKTDAQFAAQGCENCDFLQLGGPGGDRERLWSCTTSNFEGVVAIISPSESWVARWQGIDDFVPGVYAIVANGE